MAEMSNAVHDMRHIISWSFGDVVEQKVWLIAVLSQRDAVTKGGNRYSRKMNISTYYKALDRYNTVFSLMIEVMSWFNPMVADWKKWDQR